MKIDGTSIQMNGKSLKTAENPWKIIEINTDRTFAKIIGKSLKIDRTSTHIEEHR